MDLHVPELDDSGRVEAAPYLAQPLAKDTLEQEEMNDETHLGYNMKGPMRVHPDAVDLLLTEDGQAVKDLDIPQMPSLEARKQHRLTHHWLFRSWCRYCIMGRGKETPHHRTDPRRDCPQVFLDYGFISQEGPSAIATLSVSRCCL